MKIQHLVIIAAICILVGCACREGEKAAARIPIHRTIAVPVQDIGLPGAVDSLRRHPEMLAVTTGTEDELPEGPSSFDVLPGGGLVICDPLQQRLVFYNQQGAFLNARNPGFSPLRVRATDRLGEVVVQRTGSGTFYLSSPAGPPRVTTDPALTGRVNAANPARLLDRRRATIPGAGNQNITIHFENDSLLLVGVRYVGKVDNKSVVLLEASTDKTPIAIYRFLRIYDETGHWLATLEDPLEDHLVFPEDEFRLAGGFLYQMVPQREAVVIAVWKLQ